MYYFLYVNIKYKNSLKPPPGISVVYIVQILTEYRKKFGIESLRRCGTCMEGVGMKLKRCARCPEMYCSRECQTYAWEDGHKQLCNYTLDDDNSE